MGTKKDMSPKITATTDQEIIKCLMDINQISHNTALNKLKCVKHLIYFSNFLDPSNYAFFYAFIPEEFRVPDEFFAIMIILVRRSRLSGIFRATCPASESHSFSSGEAA